MRTHPFTNFRPVRLALAGLFIVVCIGLRLVWLPRDPPHWLSWSSGVYTDEGFYTLDARHWVLFGTLAPGNFHDSYTAPLLSGIQTLWFRICGVGLVQARLLDVLFALSTLALFWDMLRRRSPRGVSTAAVVMLGLSPVYLFYNCLALQETPALFWIVFGLWLIAVAASPLAPNPRGTRLKAVYASLAGACVIAAFACKSLSIVAVPALIVGAWQLGKREGLAFTAGLGVAGTAFGVLSWYPHHAEIARMSTYYAQHQILPHTAQSLWLNIRRAFVGGDRGVLPYLIATMPLSTLLAVLAFRRSRLVPIDPVAVVWLVCGLAFCLFSRYAPSRYYVLFVPALCWLAGIGWRGLSQTARRLSIAAVVAYSLVLFDYSWARRTSTVVDASRSIASFVGGSTIVGEFAPELCTGTQAMAAPMQPGISNDMEPIERLHPDYISVCRSPYWRGWWATRYPKLIDDKHLARTVRLGDHGQYTVDIYRVDNHAH